LLFAVVVIIIVVVDMRHRITPGCGVVGWVCGCGVVLCRVAGCCRGEVGRGLEGWTLTGLFLLHAQTGTLSGHVSWCMKTKM
jgi:hypothetical protein